MKNTCSICGEPGISKSKLVVFGFALVDLSVYESKLVDIDFARQSRLTNFSEVYERRLERNEFGSFLLQNKLKAQPKKNGDGPKRSYNTAQAPIAQEENYYYYFFERQFFKINF